MTAALIIAAALAATALGLYVHHRLTGGDRADSDRRTATSAPTTDKPEDECCGQHAVCARDSLLAAVSQKIEYYDDEELDIFAGRDAAGYTQAEREQFRDVMLTLLPEDVAGWARSIQLRGIALPDDVRDELLLMVSEARTSRSNA